MSSLLHLDTQAVGADSHTGVTVGPKPAHTIESLRLDIDSAMRGEIWKLLPDGFRDRTIAKTYPLPSLREELQKLVLIPIPNGKRDCGCVYLRRALRRLSERHRRSAVLRGEIDRSIEKVRKETDRAVGKVQKKAQQAIASLGELFDLGRQGIEGQMKAHLTGEEWMGETIKAKHFRDCFRMVLQGVKGLGLPNDQRASAADAVMDQVAESLRETQETVSLGPGNANETEH